MSSESPFLLSKTECPVCRTINEFEQIKVGAYTEDSRDTDFCPKNITWRYPKYQAHNPLVFFTATCGNCYYTREFTNGYREWKSDNAFRTYRLKVIKEKHLEQLSTADSVIRQLGEALDPQRYPNESAILKLHLAIFDEQLAEHPSDLDLGRFCLRIGWVFRDLEVGENPNQLLLGTLIREMDNKYFRLRETVESSQHGLDDLVGSIAAHFEVDQIPADIQSQMYSYRERYDDEMKGLSGSIQTAQERLKGFRELLDEYRSELLGGESAGGRKSFGKHSSFADFLRQLRAGWNDIVTGEREALEKAIFFYKRAFVGGRDIPQGTPQIQASYLIAELSRRVGDYDEARQYFTSTIKSGQEFIYQNRRDQSRTALVRKILELAIEQGRANLAASKPK